MCVRVCVALRANDVCATLLPTRRPSYSCLSSGTLRCNHRGTALLQRSVQIHYCVCPSILDECRGAVRQEAAVMEKQWPPTHLVSEDFFRRSNNFRVDFVSVRIMSVPRCKFADKVNVFVWNLDTTLILGTNRDLACC